MGFKENLLIAGGLILCPGDEIAAAIAQTINSTGINESLPAIAVLYEKPTFKKIRRKDAKGNELLEIAFPENEGQKESVQIPIFESETPKPNPAAA